jgi:hypothetical protein
MLLSNSAIALIYVQLLYSSRLLTGQLMQGVWADIPPSPGGRLQLALRPCSASVSPRRHRGGGEALSRCSARKDTELQDGQMLVKCWSNKRLGVPRLSGSQTRAALYRRRARRVAQGSGPARGRAAGGAGRRARAGPAGGGRLLARGQGPAPDGQPAPARAGRRAAQHPHRVGAVGPGSPPPEVGRVAGRTRPVVGAIVGGSCAAG